MNQPIRVDSGNQHMFLLYRVQEELYGTQLAGVREIIPYQVPRSVPNTKKFYHGIVNFQGAVVGVLDMRFWFQDISKVGGNYLPKALIVFETLNGLMAVAADAIESICPLESKDIEYAKNIPSNFSAGGIIGLSRFNHRLATLLDVRTLLNHVEVALDAKERNVS